MLKTKIIPLLIICFVFASCGSKKKSREGETNQHLAVLFVSGQALVKKEEALKPEPLKVGMFLMPQDTIVTGKNSTVKIKTENGSNLIFRENTHTKISAIIKTETQQEIDVIHLNWGKVTSSVRVKGKGAYFAVETPSVQVKTRGNIFTVSYAGGKTDVYLKDGEVEVKPIFKNKELEDKITGVTLIPGYQLTYTNKSIAELEKKLEEKFKGLSANPSAAELQKMQTDFQKEFNLISKQVKYDYLNDLQEQIPFDSIKTGRIEIGKQGEIVYKHSGNKSELNPVNIFAYGSEITINNGEPHKDYYSAFYPDNSKIKIIVKSPDKIVLQQELTLAKKGFDYNQASEQFIADLFNKLSDEKTVEPYFLVSENFKDKPESVFRFGNQLITIEKNNLKIYSLTDKNKQPVVIAYNPLIKPAVCSEGIFAVVGDMLTAYTLAGEKKGHIYAGKITADFSITIFNDVAYLGDEDGLVKGLNSQGKDIYYYKASAPVTSPVSVKEDLIVFGGKQAVFIQKEKKKTSFKNDAEMKYAIGLMEEKYIIPQGENNVTVTDLNGKPLVSINTQAGNIKTLNMNLFAVLTKYGVRIYNVNGSFVKAINAKSYVVTDKKILYSYRNKVYFTEFNGTESIIELPEPIYLLGQGKDDAVALTESGKVYQINF